MAIAPKLRQQLKVLAKRLYLQAGYDPKLSGLKISVMVSALAGRPVAQKAAWKWLLARYAPGRSDLPSVPRHKRPAADPFYDSPEWRAVRFEALKLSDGCCTLCGRSKRQHGVVLHVDHIKPRSKFPLLALVLSNLQVLCEDCNMGKSNRDDTDWRIAS